MNIMLKKSCSGSKRHNETSKVLSFSDRVEIIESGDPIEKRVEVGATGTTGI